MANDSSLGAGGAFNLETQNGVMQLLASIRASEVAADEKAELRDLVFLYTNGGHDESVKNSLMQKLISSGIKPVQIEQPQAAAEPEESKSAGPSIGGSRPAPQFVPSISQQAPASTPAPAPAPEPEPQPEPEPVPKPPAQPEPQPEPAVQPEAETPQPEPVPEPSTVPPAQPTPTPEPAPEIPPQPEPAVQPEAKTPQPEPATQPVPVPPAPQSSPEPVPEPPVQPAAVPQTEVGASSEEYLRRIREIKALVNERVGNPVNLVDINNEVGREYMSALLDAMKRLNNGSSSTGSMQRLEAAFAEVEKAIDEHEQSGGEVAEVPQPATAADILPETEPVSAPASTPPPEPPTVPEMPTSPSEEEPAANPVPVNVVPEPTQPAEPEAPVVPEPQAQESSEASVQSESDDRPPMPQPPTLNSVPPAPQSSTAETSTEASMAEEVEENEGTPMAPPPVMPAGAPAPKPDSMPTAGVQAPAWGPETDPKPIKDNGVRKKASSLAESGEPLRNINELPDASSLDTSADGDPLHTKEVDQGLNQLLSEWSLFKKSGLFGTGPKGSEHPLFIKIKDLQIPLLLAGRFEGATQEIKQSITDYMNGWRYEQGIIYKQGETFEEYLRRVIRHIIDLQKGK